MRVLRAVLDGWRRFYGDNPLHLLSVLGCFALVGYSMLLIWEDPSLYAILIFFVAALLVHDLLLYPLYVLADQTLTVSRWARRRALPRIPPAVPVINHIRLPAMGSAMLGLIWFPTITGRSDEAFGFAAGLPIVGRYENWLLVTALLFGLSAAVYALRLGASGARSIAAATGEGSGPASDSTSSESDSTASESDSTRTESIPTPAAASSESGPEPGSAASAAPTAPFPSTPPESGSGSVGVGVGVTTTRWVWAVALVVLLASCASPAVVPPEPRPAEPPPAAVDLVPEVLDTRPHDTSAYTQGFELAGGSLWEGTGRVGRSQLRETDPATGAVRRAVDLPADQFGEGVTVLDDRIWMLTWKDRVAHAFDPDTLELLDTVAYDREGWGICAPGTAPGSPGEVVTSDGTDTLVLRDATTLVPRRSVEVTRDGSPFAGLNELECVGDTVWANVWPTDTIVGIDLASGGVTAVVDASALRPASTRDDADAVLNGIAAIPGTDEFLLTGKLWPTTYRVRFRP